MIYALMLAIGGTADIVYDCCMFGCDHSVMKRTDRRFMSILYILILLYICAG